MTDLPTSAARTRRRPVLRGAVVGLAALALAGGTAALVGHLTATAVTTITVNNTADVDTVSDTATTCPATCHLREAVHVANNVGGTVQITVPAGTYDLQLGELRIGTFPAGSGVTSYTVTVQGAGAYSTTIRQTTANSRVIDLDPSILGNVNATLASLTITGGQVDTFGGAGVIAGSGNASGTAPDNTTLNHCVITGNTVNTTLTNKPGGGVQNIGGNLTINDCMISNNSSGSSEGGGVYYDSHSPFNGTLRVTNSTFSGNTLDNQSSVFLGGAGLHVQGTAGSHYYVNTSRFFDNIATGSGTGPVGGGGIASVQGDLQLGTSTFTGNQANGPAADNAGGGAINVSAGGDAAANFFVRLNRIVDNSASNGPSGVYAGSGLDFANNWWGCNAGPGYTGCDGVGNATTTPRLQLTATASPSTILVHGTSTVTASLRYNSSGVDTSTLLGSTLQGAIDVAFANGTYGTVWPNTGTLSSAMGAATYTAGGTGGPDSVAVTVDHQTVGAAITVQQPPTITSATSATFLALSPNSFQFTAIGWPPPTFSTTGTLPSGLSLTSSGVLAGTPAVGTGGVYSFPVTATNGVSPDDTKTFTLTVNEPPSIYSAASTTFTVGTAGSFTVLSHGYPAPSITLTSGTLPSGVSYDSSTHVLSGTPAATTGGVHPLEFTAANGIGSNDVKAFTLTVNERPYFTSAAGATFMVGTAGSFTVATGGYPVAAITVTNSLPSGVTLTDNGNGTATLAGTPAAGMGGVHHLSLSASNGVGSSATQDFTLTINEAPSIYSASGVTFTVGSPGSFTVLARGYPAPSMYELGGNPGGVWFDSATHVLSGTPVATTGGVYSVSFTAYNAYGTTTQSFTLTIDESPGIISAADATFTVGVPGSFTVTTIGYPYPAISKDATALPSGITLADNHDGTATLAGTPATGMGGVYHFVIYAANGVGTDKSQAFTLTVQEGPHFTSVDGTTFTAGSAGSFTVAANGVPTLTSIALTAGTLPAGVTYEDNGSGTGTLSGTPASGTGGTTTLTFTASNGINPDAVQTFTLTVNEAPSLTSPMSATFSVGTPVSYSFTATGYPAPAFSMAGAPAWLSLATDGHLTGTPPVGSGGVYTFSVTASNGVSPDDTRTFTATVNEAPSIYSASGTTFTVGTAGSFTVLAHGYPAPSMYEMGGNPGGVWFDSATHVLSGTPVDTTGGVYSLTFTAYNTHGTSTQAFTLTVDESPGIISAADATFTVGVPGSFTVTTIGWPYPVISKDATPLPSGLSFADNHDGTATLSGTAAPGTGGVYHFVVYATNGVGMDKSQAFTLTVQAGPHFTSADTATFTAGSFGSFSVAATGLPDVTGIALTDGTLPDGVSYVDNHDGSGTLSGTPGAGTGGLHALTFTATNGAPPDAVQAFTLVVDEAPSITSSSSATFTTGSAVDFTVTTAGYPVATSVTESGTLPSGVSFSDNGNGTGTLSGTPASGTGGVYSISFGASNGVAPDAAQSFSLVITQHPLITSAAGATFTAGSFGSFTVMASGYPAPSIGEQGTLPGGVTFVDNGDGTGILSGTPVTGSGGVHDISFGANNGVEPAASQHFVLTVQQAPAITSANHTTFQVGASNSFSVTSSGYPAPSLGSSGSLPSGVTFSDNGNGTATLAGTPTSGSSGDWPLTFTAHNGAGSDATQAFTLTVGASPTTTVATASTTTPSFGQTVTFTATVSPASATGSVTFSVAGVTKATGALSSGQATWTTKSLQMGAHTITATYGGAAGTYLSSSGSVTVTVGATQTITGTRKGGVSITGGSWYVSGAKISGGLTISGGASVAIVNSTINNGITATGAGMLTVCGDSTAVGGSITVSGSTGFVLIGSAGDDADMPCTANSIGGGVTLNGNSGGLEVGGNTIRGAVVVNNNVLYGPAYDTENAAPEVEANTIKGSLSCSGNVPPPTDDLTPNKVSGSRTGQCGGAGF